MSETVMIVDDSPAMRKFIRRAIEVVGLFSEPPLEASRGEEALDLLREHAVSLILSDINMPGMGGEEFIRVLSEDQILSRIPVVVVSTDATAVRMRRLFGLGARGYLVKPFTPERLKMVLEKAMAAAAVPRPM